MERFGRRLPSFPSELGCCPIPQLSWHVVTPSILLYCKSIFCCWCVYYYIYMSRYWVRKHGMARPPVIDKSLDLEKSREEITPYFLACSRKLIFHFSFYSQFSRFFEKILFLFLICEIFKAVLFLFSIFKIFKKKFSFSSRLMRL